MTKLTHQRWILPLTIIATATTMLLLDFSSVQSSLRIIVAFGFLLLCPGLAFIPLLRLPRVAIQLTLALGLSVVLDGSVAIGMLYTNMWSPQGGLVALVWLSMLGAVLQLVVAHSAWLSLRAWVGIWRRSRWLNRFGFWLVLLVQLTLLNAWIAIRQTASTLSSATLLYMINGAVAWQLTLLIIGRLRGHRPQAPLRAHWMALLIFLGTLVASVITLVLVVQFTMLNAWIADTQNLIALSLVALLCMVNGAVAWQLLLLVINVLRGLRVRASARSSYPTIHRD